jgi:hypothetical protein
MLSHHRNNFMKSLTNQPVIMRTCSIFSASLVVGSLASSLQLPATSGPFSLGTVSLELVDSSRTDPLAPSPQDYRELMVSLIYPTDVASCENVSFSPVFSPQTGTYFDNYYGVPNGTAASIISRSYLNAPLVDNELPILIFGHGFGASRLIYTSQLFVSLFSCNGSPIFMFWNVLECNTLGSVAGLTSPLVKI